VNSPSSLAAQSAHDAKSIERPTKVLCLEGMLAIGAATRLAASAVMRRPATYDVTPTDALTRIKDRRVFACERERDGDKPLNGKSPEVDRHQGGAGGSVIGV
jgi:hypothetical protein